jgi:GNAT superfamily N-acetyltransferase
VRFAIREAKATDVEAIARAHVASWQDSYRGILPDNVIDRVDVGQRAASRRRMLADPRTLTLVAYDVTHHDIVGLCDAGPARRAGRWAGEIYALYLVHHAKRHGLGRELFDATSAWLRANGMPSLVIWVLDNNLHARRFYEAMGGRAEARYPSTIAGFPIVELSYVWDRL